MKRYLTSASEERNIENIPAKDLNLHMFLHGDKEERWRPIRTHNTDFISSKSTTINSTLLYMDQLLISWKTSSFRCPERPFPQEKGSYYAILAREIAHEPLVPCQTQKRTWCLSEANLATKILKSCKELPGGSCHSTSGSEHAMRVESWSGVGDVKLQINAETGNEELVWTAERGSKCRNGEVPGRPFCPIAQTSNNALCPVFFYKAFRSHRPTEMNNQESPFYLAINHKRKPSDTVWYMNAPLGKNSIGKFLKMAAKRTGLQGNVTNHALRKTHIGGLLDADVPANYVAQLSGHKNLKSLDSYKSESLLHQRKMSLVLTRSEHVKSTANTATTNKLANNIYSIWQ